MADAKTKKDEPKLSLPAGHPSAAYVSPDLSAHEGTGTIPDEEVAWHEDRNDAQQAEVEAAADAEHKAATEEQKALEEQAAADEKAREENAGVSSTKSTTTASTKSS